MQAVERMEELFLGRLFARDKLDIVHQQDIDRAVLGAELVGGAVANGVDNIIGELLRGDVEHRQPGLHPLMADGVQEVGLAQSHAAIEEERVVRLARCLRDGQGGCVCQAVAAAHDKGIEGIARIEPVVHQDIGALLVLPILKCIACIAAILLVLRR